MSIQDDRFGRRPWPDNHVKPEIMETTTWKRVGDNGRDLVVDVRADGSVGVGIGDGGLTVHATLDPIAARSLWLLLGRAEARFTARHEGDGDE